jgi:hypothetical protein
MTEEQLKARVISLEKSVLALTMCLIGHLDDDDPVFNDAARSYKYIQESMRDNGKFDEMIEEGVLNPNFDWSHKKFKK